MKKPKHIYCDVYRANFYVSINTPADMFVKQVKKYLQCDIGTIDDMCGGKCLQFNTDNGQIFWIWSEEDYLYVIMHEIFHAVSMLLRSRGMELSDESEEAYSYMFDFLVRKILGEKRRMK